MCPLSQDLRKRIIAARQSGAGTGEVCQRYGVSRKSVERFWNEHRRTGHCPPKQVGGYRQLGFHSALWVRWTYAAA